MCSLLISGLLSRTGRPWTSSVVPVVTLDDQSGSSCLSENSINIDKFYNSCVLRKRETVIIIGELRSLVHGTNKH